MTVMSVMYRMPDAVGDDVDGNRSVPGGSSGPPSFIFSSKKASTPFAMMTTSMSDVV